MARYPGVPGSTTWRARRSASMTGRQWGGAERQADTVDFPVAIDPVRPTMSILPFRSPIWRQTGSIVQSLPKQKGLSSLSKQIFEDRNFEDDRGKIIIRQRPTWNNFNPCPCLMTTPGDKSKHRRLSKTWSFYNNPFMINDEWWMSAHPQYVTIITSAPSNQTALNLKWQSGFNWQNISISHHILKFLAHQPSLHSDRQANLATLLLRYLFSVPIIYVASGCKFIRSWKTGTNKKKTLTIHHSRHYHSYNLFYTQYLHLRYIHLPLFVWWPLQLIELFIEEPGGLLNWHLLPSRRHRIQSAWERSPPWRSG